MLKIARESRGVTQPDLAARLKVTPTAYWYWENARFDVSSFQLSQLSKLLEYPESFFLQQGELPALPLAYRKRGKGVSVQQFKQLDANTQIFCMNMELLINAVQLPAPMIPSLDVAKYGSPQACATALRKLWNIPKGPIENVAEVLEKHGILISVLDFGTQRVDGRVCVAREKYPAILTNENLLGDRQRFTLAYHLGWIVMHMKATPDFKRELSHEANLFAADFLMPSKDIKADLQGLTFEKLPELKKKWKSSMISLLHRAEDLGCISESQKKRILAKFNASGIRTREPRELDVPVENYKLVRDLITTYKTKQKLNAIQIARFFHLEQDDFLARYTYNS